MAEQEKDGLELAEVDILVNAVLGDTEVFSKIADIGKDYSINIDLNNAEEAVDTLVKKIEESLAGANTDVNVSFNIDSAGLDNVTAKVQSQAGQIREILIGLTQEIQNNYSELNEAIANQDALGQALAAKSIERNLDTLEKFKSLYKGNLSDLEIRLDANNVINLESGKKASTALRNKVATILKDANLNKLVQTDLNPMLGKLVTSNLKKYIGDLKGYVNSLNQINKEGNQKITQEQIDTAQKMEGVIKRLLEISYDNSLPVKFKKNEDGIRFDSSTFNDTHNKLASIAQSNNLKIITVDEAAINFTDNLDELLKNQTLNTLLKVTSPENSKSNVASNKPLNNNINTNNADNKTNTLTKPVQDYLLKIADESSEKEIEEAAKKIGEIFNQMAIKDYDLAQKKLVEAYKEYFETFGLKIKDSNNKKFNFNEINSITEIKDKNIKQQIGYKYLSSEIARSQEDAINNYNENIALKISEELEKYNNVDNNSVKEVYDRIISLYNNFIHSNNSEVSDFLKNLLEDYQIPSTQSELETNLKTLRSLPDSASSNDSNNVSALESELEVAKNKINEAEQEIIALKQRIVEFENEKLNNKSINSSEDVIASKDNQIQELNKTIEQLKSKINDLDSKNKELDSIINNSEKTEDVDVIKNEKSELEKQLLNLKDRINALEEKLAQEINNKKEDNNFSIQSSNSDQSSESINSTNTNEETKENIETKINSQEELCKKIIETQNAFVEAAQANKDFAENDQNTLLDKIEGYNKLKKQFNELIALRKQLDKSYNGNGSSELWSDKKYNNYSKAIDSQLSIYQETSALQLDDVAEGFVSRLNEVKNTEENTLESVVKKKKLYQELIVLCGALNEKVNEAIKDGDFIDSNQAYKFFDINPVDADSSYYKEEVNNLNELISAYKEIINLQKKYEETKKEDTSNYTKEQLLERKQNQLDILNTIQNIKNQYPELDSKEDIRSNKEFWKNDKGWFSLEQELQSAKNSIEFFTTGLEEISKKAVKSAETNINSYIKQFDSESKKSKPSIKKQTEILSQLEASRANYLPASIENIRGRKLNPNSNIAYQEDIDKINEMFDTAINKIKEAIQKATEEAAKPKTEQQSKVVSSPKQNIPSTSTNVSTTNTSETGYPASTGTPVDMTTEVTKIDELAKKVNEVTVAVESKTKAFEVEKKNVDTYINAELKKLNELKTALEQIVLSNVFKEFSPEEQSSITTIASSIKEALNEALSQVTFPEIKVKSLNKDEIKKLEKLETQVKKVTDAVLAKTGAFEDEHITVTNNVQDEINKLLELLEVLKNIKKEIPRGTIQAIKESKIENKDNDSNVDNSGTNKNTNKQDNNKAKEQENQKIIEEGNKPLKELLEEKNKLYTDLEKNQKKYIDNLIEGNQIEATAYQEESEKLIEKDKEIAKYLERNKNSKGVLNQISIPKGFGIDYAKQAQLDAFKGSDTVDKFSTKIDNQIKKLNSAKQDINNIKKDIGEAEANEFEKQVNEQIDKLNQLKKSASETQQVLEILLNTQENDDNSYKKVLSNSEQLITEITNTKKGINQEKSTNKINRQYEGLITDLLNWSENNSRALKDSGIFNEYNRIMEALQNDADRTQTKIQGLRADFEKLQGSALVAGKTGDTMLKSFSKSFDTLGQKMIVNMGLDYLRQGFTMMLNNVKDIDRAMTELKKVTDETDESYKKFLSGAGVRAEALGSSMTNLIESTANFAKLGYNLQDAAKLSENAIMYSNVGDLDIQTATSDLISVSKAFKMSADETQRIVDSFNEVGNKYAVSAQQLGAALNRSASTLVVGGNTLDESIAMITAMTEINSCLHIRKLICFHLYDD